MDEEQKALNQEAEEINSRAASPAVEEQVPEEAEQVESTEETEAVETEGESKKGAQSRIRELNQKARSAEEKVKTLEERIAELTGSTQTPEFTPNRATQTYAPQDPIAQPGEELDANEFQRRVLAQADARTELRIRQSEAVSRINNETSAVMRAHPELDPESESFNKDLSEAITEAVENAVKANPYTASPKSVVARLMKPYQGAVAKEVGQASEQIAKQASQAALRPTTVRKAEKTASEKSIAELERDLGIVQA